MTPWRAMLGRPRAERHLTAAIVALATFVIAALTAPAVGISRDESVYFVAGESYAQWWSAAFRAPTNALRTIDGYYGVNHEHPGLAKLLFGIGHALFAEILRWTSHMQGFRLATFAFAALMSYVLSLWGRDLAGRSGAWLAPSFFWLVPRHFYHAHPAVFDMPVTALWLATLYAYRGSLKEPTSRRWALAAGCLFGLAVSVKHNAWFIPPICLAHWLATRGGNVLRGRLSERLRAIPASLIAMALIGPVVFVATWPWLWRDPVGRFRDYLAFHAHHEHYSWHYLGEVMRKPPFPIAYPFVVTALTVPAGILASMTGGLVHGFSRIVSSIRRGNRDVFGDELLLVANALFSILLIAHPQVPHFGGVKHWLPAMPFLALLGARAVVTACRILLPARPTALLIPVVALIAVPAAWGVAHVHPFGTAAYNELAGGAGGAATLGMQRQFWGDNMVAALPAINEHAAPGARIWYQEATWDAVRAYQRDGRLRPDLQWADGPDDAQISVYHYHQEFRDKEFSTWARFGTRKPVSGVYLDEVPLIEVYARTGAWRE